MDGYGSLINLGFPSKCVGGEVQSWGSAGKNVKVMRFFDIYIGDFTQDGGYLGQKCVNREVLTFWSKIGIIVPEFPGKMTIFPVLTQLLHLSLPKLWHSHPHKNYIFAMSSN